MLPGFRFLFAAIVLSFSILVFGLGAAALLRAAHEAFAANPSFRIPEPKFVQTKEAPLPVLAMLRVEPAAAEPNALDGIPLAEPPAIAAVPGEPEKIAALQPQDSSPPEAVPPEMALPETSMQGAAEQAAAEQVRIATAAQVLPPAQEAAAPLPEQAVASCATDGWIGATRIATLGGPSVAIEAEPSAKAGAGPDSSAVKKRIQARRLAQRRKAARRAWLARQAEAQQVFDPFGQPTVNLPSR